MVIGQKKWTCFAYPFHEKIYNQFQIIYNIYMHLASNNQEDAITYSRLLYYNVLGLKETTGINIINFL